MGIANAFCFGEGALGLGPLGLHSASWGLAAIRIVVKKLSEMLLSKHSGTLRKSISCPRLASCRLDALWDTAKIRFRHTYLLLVKMFGISVDLMSLSFLSVPFLVMLMSHVLFKC